MSFKTFLNRLLILGFMGIAGFSLAKAIYYKSILGIVLALVSLGAGVCFLYLLVKAEEETMTHGQAGKRGNTV